jgi:hypothetical protein
MWGKTLLSGGGPRSIAVMGLGVLLATLGVSGLGYAQNSVQVSGVIQQVDCRAQTVTLSGPAGLNTIVAGPYTAVLVNATAVPFCSLQQYIGAPATAWLMASGNEFAATRIDVVVATTSPPPPPVYYPYYGPPFWFGIGIVIGPGFHGPGFHHHRR